MRLLGRIGARTFELELDQGEQFDMKGVAPDIHEGLLFDAIELAIAPALDVGPLQRAWRVTDMRSVGGPGRRKTVILIVEAVRS